MGNSISIGSAYSDQNVSGSANLGHGTTANQATDTLGFYGVTPIVQRPYTASLHLSSTLSTSTTFSAAHLAAVNELQATMVALGIWATV